MGLQKAALPEITLGDQLANNIKRLFYSNQEWPKVVLNIGKDIAKLKILGRRYYPELTECDLIRKLYNYTDDDLMESFKLLPNNIQLKGLTVNGKNCF